MSTTHRVLPLTHNLDLVDYISEVPHLDLQAHLMKSFVNNVDFLIINCVRSVWRYLNQEVLAVDQSAAINEVADAVKQLQLAELSFFEAGSSGASIIDQVQHLMELRPGWIEVALEAQKHRKASRSTIQALFAAAEKLDWEPKTIEDQLGSPKYNLSFDAERRTREVSFKTALQFGKTEDEAKAKADADIERLRRQNSESERSLKDRTPIYCAVFNIMLSTDVRQLRTVETRGRGHSTQDNPDRAVHVAGRTFATLPAPTRVYFMSKAMDDAAKFREWESKRRMSDYDWASIDNNVDKVIADLKTVVHSPKMEAAARTAETA